MILIFLVPALLTAQSEFSSIAGKPGAFSRMGFGARGKGMANAMSSVTQGNLSSYYNPALIVFQKDNSFQSSYSFLSLDRTLNFLSFTRNFEFGFQNPDGSKRDKPRATAGLSIGLINAGVGEFDQRDNQGMVTGKLSPFENQFFLAFANKFSERLAIGFGAKFYYAKLYDDITSTSFGFDLGALYKWNDNLNFSFALIDINSRYKWDTNKIYQQDGRNSNDEFPLLKRIGASYIFDNPSLLISIEFEGINSSTNFLRFGAEYLIHENLFLRGGVDNFNISNTDLPVRPSLGFSYLYSFGTFISNIDYAFSIEPYSTHDQHIIGIGINF